MDAGHSRYEMNHWVTTVRGDVICDMDGLSRSRNELEAKDDGGADAEFIANAPTDQAKLIAAVEGVLGLHKPVDPSPSQPWVTCAGCTNGNCYPCPTVRALTRALEGRDGCVCSVLDLGPDVVRKHGDDCDSPETTCEDCLFYASDDQKPAL
jgi:hypothetical protein